MMHLQIHQYFSIIKIKKQKIIFLKKDREIILNLLLLRKIGLLGLWRIEHRRELRRQSQKPSRYFRSLTTKAHSAPFLISRTILSQKKEREI
jgi:hypothetical protein